MARRKLAARLVRGFFVGNVVGLIGGLGLYIANKAVNLIANSTVLNPVGLLMMVYGFCIAAAVGIELSKYLDEEEGK